MRNKKYLLLTDDYVLISKGILVNSFPDGTMQLRITEGNMEIASEYKSICLIGDSREDDSNMCLVLRQNDDVIMVKKIKSLNPELRRSFRVSVEFDTFIYPVSGKWKGRYSAKSIDISCGGIAFYSKGDFQIGEIGEIVISNLSKPVIVKMQIIRKEAFKDGLIYYASKFINLSPDEDKEVCKSVFSVQVQKRKNDFLSQ